MSEPGGGPTRRTTDILHLDMDCFFAAVEVLDDDRLRGLPVVVGGTGPRGVVASASYEARVHGVHSAMPSAVAQRLCPSVVFVSPRHGRYGEVSEALMEILRSVTPLVEPVSLDEAYLDVSGSHALFGDSVAIATKLRQAVTDTLALACSVGIGTTKLVAKLASRDAKPQLTRTGIAPGAGVKRVAPDDEPDYLRGQRVGAIPGVGTRTLESLAKIGVVTVGDLQDLDRGQLVARFGSSRGAGLYNLARGIDGRVVEPDRATRSIGQEHTFDTDVHERATLVAAVREQARAVAARCRVTGVAGRTVTVKVRDADFTTRTRSSTATRPLLTSAAIAKLATELLDRADLARGVRLVGVSISNLEATGAVLIQQLALFSEGDASPPHDPRHIQVDTVTDAIRLRFGAKAITQAPPDGA